MVRFIMEGDFNSLITTITYLHSNMVRFIMETIIKSLMIGRLFTFQYG